MAAQGEAAITSASDICPASSTNNTSTLPAMSSRDHSQEVPPTTSMEPAASWSLAASLLRRCAASRYAGSSAPVRWPMVIGTPSSCATAAAFSSSSPITLWLFAVTPTRFPAATRSTIIRAPTVLLPEPGGPWIAR